MTTDRINKDGWEKCRWHSREEDTCLSVSCLHLQLLSFPVRGCTSCRGNPARLHITEQRKEEERCDAKVHALPFSLVIPDGKLCLEHRHHCRLIWSQLSLIHKASLNIALHEGNVFFWNNWLTSGQFHPPVFYSLTWNMGICGMQILFSIDFGGHCVSKFVLSDW